MKTPTLLLLLCLCAGSVSAQASRFVTLIVDAVAITNQTCSSIDCDANGCVTNQVPCRPFTYGSNSLALAEGEVAKVVTITGPSWQPEVSFQKGGRWFPCTKGDVIQGPALITAAISISIPLPTYGLATLEVLPEAFPPDRTLLLPQGSNTVAVALECSVDLVHWTTATNGIYGTPNTAKFFRIRAEK